MAKQMRVARGTARRIRRDAVRGLWQVAAAELKQGEPKVSLARFERGLKEKSHV